MKIAKIVKCQSGRKPLVNCPECSSHKSSGGSYGVYGNSVLESLVYIVKHLVEEHGVTSFLFSRTGKSFKYVKEVK